MARCLEFFHELSNLSCPPAGNLRLASFVNEVQSAFLSSQDELRISTVLPKHGVPVLPLSCLTLAVLAQGGDGAPQLNSGPLESHTNLDRRLTCQENITYMPRSHHAHGFRSCHRRTYPAFLARYCLGTSTTTYFPVDK